MLLIDEGSMVSLRHWTRRCQMAVKTGATIISTCDERQLPAVNAIAPMKSLLERCTPARLEEIRRQHSEWSRDASELFARGDVVGALGHYAARGYVHNESETPDDALEKLVRRWAQSGVADPEGNVIAVSTNDQVEAANEMSQFLRIQSGHIPNHHVSRVVTSTDDQTGRIYTNTIHVGDVVRFTANGSGVAPMTCRIVVVIDQRSLKYLAGNSAPMPSRRVQSADELAEMRLWYQPIRE